MKTLVIYHSADYDGIFCREIAKRFLGEEDVEYVGWNFGQDYVPYEHDGITYVLDLPLHGPTNVNLDVQQTFKEFIWIDHHKSSIETHPNHIPGYRIDGVAACRLAWQWFTIVDGHSKREGAEIGIPIRPAGILPMIQDFKNREVNEPLSVRLAGEYDIWDKRDPNAETFQYALRSCDEPPWNDLLKGYGSESTVENMLIGGRIVQKYSQKIDESICKSLTWLMEWEGLKFLCINHARFNSLVFAAKDKPETGHDALLGFRFDGKQWMVSLYHAKHRMDLDLSMIAKKYDGGGHRGACGFVCKTLPFQL